MRRLVYHVWQAARLGAWRLAGARRVTAMGVSLKLHPQSARFGRRGLSLPRGRPRSKIVAYSDLVQVHSLCDFLERVPHAPTIVEVGAYHGAYAVLLGTLAKAKGGMVVAVEPEPSNRAILVENVRKNGLDDTVSIVDCAVSNRSGECSLAFCGSQTVMCPSDVADDRVVRDVRVRTLSEIIESVRLDQVDVLLVDVEGAELQVLEGFPWETMMPSMIFCELHPYNWPDFGYQGSDFSAFLRKRDLRCVDMYHAEHTCFDGTDYLGPCLLSPR
jgi:FkbM family methyltransferase